MKKKSYDDRQEGGEREEGRRGRLTRRAREGLTDKRGRKENGVE